jgi:hypothetical protein
MARISSSSLINGICNTKTVDRQHPGNQIKVQPQKVLDQTYRDIKIWNRKYFNLLEAELH